MPSSPRQGLDLVSGWRTTRGRGCARGRRWGLHQRARLGVDHGGDRAREDALAELLELPLGDVAQPGCRRRDEPREADAPELEADRVGESVGDVARGSSDRRGAGRARRPTAEKPAISVPSTSKSAATRGPSGPSSISCVNRAWSAMPLATEAQDYLHAGPSGRGVSGLPGQRYTSIECGLVGLSPLVRPPGRRAAVARDRAAGRIPG